MTRLKIHHLHEDNAPTMRPRVWLGCHERSVRNNVLAEPLPTAAEDLSESRRAWTESTAENRVPSPSRSWRCSRKPNPAHGGGDAAGAGGGYQGQRVGLLHYSGQAPAPAAGADRWRARLVVAGLPDMM